MKKCKKCSVEYDSLSMFGKYKNRKGIVTYGNVCKRCQSEYKKQHYLDNKQKYKDKTREWRINNHDRYIAYQRNYYKVNKELLSHKNKQYLNSDRGKAIRNRISRSYRSNPKNLEKYKARVSVRIALKNGVLLKPSICSNCSMEGYVEAHHPNYKKPLEVVWLCKKCHENTHHLNEGQTSI